MNKALAFVAIALLAGAAAFFSLKKIQPKPPGSEFTASPKSGAAPLVVVFSGIKVLGKVGSFGEGDQGLGGFGEQIPPTVTHVYWNPGVFKAGAPGNEVEVKVEGSRISQEFEAKESELRAKFTGEGSGVSRGYCRLGNLSIFTVEGHDSAKAETWYYGEDFRSLGDATFQMRPPGEAGGPVHTGGAFAYDPKECHAP